MPTPTRKVIFLGHHNDRGPKIKETRKDSRVQ